MTEKEQQLNSVRADWFLTIRQKEEFDKQFSARVQQLAAAEQLLMADIEQEKKEAEKLKAKEAKT